MKDHVKRVLRALRTELPDCEVVPLRQKTHHVFEIRRGEVSRRLAVSVSPKDVDHAVMNAVKEAKKIMEAACQI